MQVHVKFTYDDYELIPEEKKCELIDGDLIMSPSASFRHQVIAGNINEILRAFVRKYKLGKVLYEFDMYLDDENIFRPDVMFIANENLVNVTAKYLRGVPDLVIEVLSPSTKKNDTIIKKGLYAKFGLAEYWIADPETKTLDVFHLTPKGFALQKSYTPSDTLVKTIADATLTIAVAEIFAD
jgi:Uma2 family endonuclease